nr:hypothetical protein [Tanacetum cinerariifolium]
MAQNIDFSSSDPIQTPQYHEIHLSSQETSDEVFQANHSIQNEESFESPSNKIVVSNSNQEKEEPAQESDIHQLIEECSTEICEEQKQSMEDMMLEFVKSVKKKSFFEVKNVVEQPAEHRNRYIQSLQNFRVVHKNSISLKNTSQISSIHEVTPILSTKEPEHLLSMGYEHLSITPETESDEVIESNAENLLPIPSECEVTLEDKRKCDLPLSENSPVCDDHSDIFSDSKIGDDILVYDDDFKDIEYVEASPPDPEIVSVEEENVVQQEEEEFDLEDISQIQDIVLREKLLSITRLISNIESLNDSPTPDCVLNSFESDNFLLDTFSPEFETFCDHSEETRSGNTTHADNSLPKYDSFYYEIEADHERLINLVKNDISDDFLLEETDLFLSDNSIPPGIENFADDPEGDIRDEIPVVMNDKDEDIDYSSFMFVIFDKVFSFLSAESEDTIFDPANKFRSLVLRILCLWSSTSAAVHSPAPGKKHYFTDAPESCGISHPTATSTNPPADHMETLAVETTIPTVSSPILTACLNDSLEPSSDTRPISKRVTSQDDTASLDNILTLTNRFEDILGVTTNTDDTNGVEADLGNMKTTITASPTPTLRIHKDHPKSQIIGVRPIRTKWVLKNKKDERGIVIRNKVMLVAQGHTQEEGIDYDEVFAPVVRIETIRLFLAYASFMGFTVYQMDVKSAFLYGTIDEEVYVMQPPGFHDPEFPARVYKVEKAMYGLHQAPRAWYGTLSKYLLTNGFQRGIIDQTLFIRRHRGDFILVQVYVDDIFFGSSNPQLCREFEALMHEKFQMSPMGELNFFIGLQVLQKKDGIFLSQDKKDGTGKDVDLHHYRSMIGSLMYLTESRPDIMFAVCACARHQVTPKECHMHAVKRIFRYLKRHPKLGLWYPKESPFDLVAYLDSDYGGAFRDRKSTTGGSASCCGQVLWIQNQLLDYGLSMPCEALSKEISSSILLLIVPLFDSMLVQQGEGSGTPTESHHTPTSEALQSSHHEIPSPSLPSVPTESLLTVIPSDNPPLRQYTKRARIAQSSALPPVADEPASPIGDDSQREACPTDSGLEADQDRANIAKTSTLPSDSTPRVTSLAADEDNDAPIKGRSLDEGEEAAERVSDDTEEMATVLTSMDAASILTSGRVQVVPTAAEVATVTISIPTGSRVVSTACPTIPTAALIFTTATDSIPYTRRKGKEKMVESDTPKKKKLQEQIDVQIMIDGLDKNNETVAKYLQEYQQFATEFPIGRRIELISDLVKYQDNYAKVPKYQTQQMKSLTRKQQREFYTSVLRNQAGWKAKDFNGMTLEEIKEKFDPVWKQIQEFVPIGLKEEAERFKRKCLRLEQKSVKKLKTSEEVLLLAWDRVFEIKNAFQNKQYKPEDMQELFRKLFNDVQNIHEELTEYINNPSWNRHAFSNYDDDDDEDYTIAITPEEPDNSLSMGDEHLDSILETESEKVIKSSVEDVVPIPSEPEGIPDNTCDVPFRDISPPLDASPPDSKLVILDGEIEDDNLRENFLNINLLIAKIESLNDNPTPDHVLNDHTEETSSGSTTTHADYSLPKYDSFLFEIEPNQGELTSVVMEDNLGEPRVHMPNVLPTHPTLMLDSDFIPSDNSLPESEIFLFDIEEKNSGSTTIHADISLPDLECFNFKSEPDSDELTSIVDSGIRKNIVSATN